MKPAGHRNRKRRITLDEDVTLQTTPKGEATVFTLQESADRRRLVQQRAQVPLSRNINGPGPSSFTTPLDDLNYTVHDHLDSGHPWAAEETEHTHRPAQIDYEDEHTILPVGEDGEVEGRSGQDDAQTSFVSIFFGLFTFGWPDSEYTRIHLCRTGFPTGRSISTRCCGLRVVATGKTKNTACRVTGTRPPSDVKIVSVTG